MSVTYDDEDAGFALFMLEHCAAAWCEPIRKCIGLTGHLDPLHCEWHPTAGACTRTFWLWSDNAGRYVRGCEDE